jgi:hypothetical protein
MKFRGRFPRVVTTGKKKSPNADPCRSRKATNMGTWCLGVQLGHLALGVDKYGGLNLQVGGERQAENLSLL